MTYRVDVALNPGQTDGRAPHLLSQIADLGITGVEGVEIQALYFLRGERLDDASVARLVVTLLLDPVIEQASWHRAEGSSVGTGAGNAGAGFRVEVAWLPGVTDSAAENLREATRRIGIALEEAATGTVYRFVGCPPEQERIRIAERLLANPVVQRYAIDTPVPAPFLTTPPAPRGVETVPLCELDDPGLEALSRERRLALDQDEMAVIRAHFRRLGREPTDLELEMLAQTWSEHCVHKTFRATIELCENGGAPQEIKSLLATYIRGATEAVNKPWVRSAFVDNAGIVAFDDAYDLAFKVETHNHPSALEPFGGANTGVGGVVRDVIGVSARPIATTDVLCFGPLDSSFDQLPEGVTHPRRIAAGVIAGIEDYGNKMGIPTVNGAILYRPGYTANPLVFCGCLGILPRGSHPRAPQVDDLVVLLGGRTGRDGLRGATFSSMEMDTETSQIAGSAVQIGHPINEKKTLEAILLARDQRLYTAITDCGAGGLSSAVGEMAEVLGAEVQLERVPLKYPGLAPWEIWLSEAQERMVLAVPGQSWPTLDEICRGLDVEATVLGRFTGDGRIHVHYAEQTVGEIETEFLHHGLARRRMVAVWDSPLPEDEPAAPAGDLGAVLLDLLASPDIRSKEDVVRQYDHEVQGGTVVKPFVGATGHGPGDAVVLSPLDCARSDTEYTGPGVALAVGINPSYGAIDPYAMAWAAVDEAMRNLVAVGANPDRVALLDNFCWGNPSLPDRLGALARCARGCHDAAIAFGAPFVSGKDSLNNEYTGEDGAKHAIPGTILISALGVVDDLRRTVTMDLKNAGDLIYVIGITDDELGGSAFLAQQGRRGNRAPAPRPHGLALCRGLHQAIQLELIRACHDCSEGGLAVALAEMAVAGGLGLDATLASAPHTAAAAPDHVIAFAESLSRFVVEVAPDKGERFEDLMAARQVELGRSQPLWARIGTVSAQPRMRLSGSAGEPIIDIAVLALERAFCGVEPVT